MELSHQMLLIADFLRKLFFEHYLNRLKVVLAEKQRTNKWLAEQLGKDQTTISKWCTNSSQPDLGNLMLIAKILDVELTDLVRFEEFKHETE